MTALTPGCHKTQAGFYRPIIFEAHGKCYFCEKTFPSASAAVDYAETSIDNVTFPEWHAHDMVTEHDGHG